VREPQVRLPRLQGVRVLVVDDDDDTREILATVLEMEGAVVIDSPSAAQAFETLQRERPDVLLTDLSMPTHDGFWLIEQVRALPAAHGGATPAAALTGRVTPEDQAAVLQAGFQFHVAKPAHIGDLVSIVAVLAVSDVFAEKESSPRLSGS
jgi:CheY-like chemotaxis protein